MRIQVFPDTVYGHATTQTRLQSETADNIAWARYTQPTPDDPQLAPALSRMAFTEVSTPAPLHYLIERALQLSESAADERSRLLVLAGRSRRLAVENHHAELKQLIDEHGPIGTEVKKTVGDLATALIVTGSKASIVVLQAANVLAD